MTESNTEPHPLIQEYLRELHVLRQLSAHTLKAYQRDLLELEQFAQAEKVDLKKVMNAQIRRWAARLHAQGKSARTIARALSAWRGWYNWMSKKKLQVNPVDDVKAPKRQKSLPKALSVEQALALIAFAAKEAAPKDAWEALRDLAILELLYSSGLRLSELLGLDLEPSQKRGETSQGWLDWQAAEVNVLGKGNKRRTVPVGGPALEVLKHWRAIREERLKDKVSAALFISSQGSRLSPRTVQARLRSLAIRSGLPTHVHPHMLRHSFASHVLQSSHDLRAVQEMLGNASIASTQIYTSLDFQHLAQVYDKAHPRAKTKS